MKSDKTVPRIVSELSLEPHPEGGYYREMYRSKQQVQATDGRGRKAGTGIYFLVPEQVCTNWHRVRSDELWHFYMGDELMLEIIDEDQQFQQLVLGDAVNGRGEFQQLVPAHCWQRAYSTGSYSLVGCTVSPGFEFEDFEMKAPKELVKQFPTLEKEICYDPFGDS